MRSPRGTRRTPGWSGARVAVFGAGPIGLLAIAVALDRGAASVVSFELQERRRGAALAIGAEAAHTDIAQDAGGGIFDIAVEASGHPARPAAALKCLGPLGRLVQMGVADPDVTLPLAPSEVFAKELMIIGSFSVADAYAEAVDVIPDLAGSLAPLVTERLGLSRVPSRIGPSDVTVQHQGRHRPRLTVNRCPAGGASGGGSLARCGARPRRGTLSPLPSAGQDARPG